jgi:hydroxymethylpyrimidine/phosphomethylpyrimidine kinase
MKPCVLVFAGLDPSGGAGLSADLQAVAGQGAHALTVCTALTVQDNDRVFGVQPVEADMVHRQAWALIGKCAISAVKIGIAGSAANALAIAEVIAHLRERQPELPVVLDPVLASGHGDLLSRDDAVQALAPLLPLTTIITPNGPEAQALGDATRPDAQAQALRARGCRHILVTGGHGDGADIVNRWYGPGVPREWRWARLAGEFHGSGCTLASAIAGQLGLGVPIAVALEHAQRYTDLALRDAYAIAEGQRIPLR